MGHHCCSKQKVKRGLWSPEEDEKLVRYITAHGHGCWSSVPKLSDFENAGLQRCGKSCRLRWINYLRPDLKRGTFTEQEERIIVDVHRILGNRWAQIAKHLPGRTDNEVKNFWNSCIKKKIIAQGLDPKTHNLLPSSRNGSSSSSNTCHGLPEISIAPFTISSHVKGYEAVKTKPTDINPPVVTLPTTSLHFNCGTSSSNFHNIDPNSVLMSFKDQESQISVDYSNNRASPLDQAPHLGSSFKPLGLMDEACMWSAAVDTVEPPTYSSMELIVEGHGQQQPTMVSKFAASESATQEKRHDVDPSYESTSFDLELIEMPLITCDAFCNTSSMEELHWGF